MASRPRLTSLLLVACLLGNLILPGVVAASPGLPVDPALTVSVGGQLKRVLESVCARVSDRQGQDLRVEAFIVDEARSRIFVELRGRLRLEFQGEPTAVQRRFLEAGGSCVTTNGPLSVDGCVERVETLGEGRHLLHVVLAVTLLLRPMAHGVVAGASRILGAATVGAALGRFVEFLESLDVERLGSALRDALASLGSVGSGRDEAEAYGTLDDRGFSDVKRELMATVSLRSVLLHVGAFVLDAGVVAGAVVVQGSFAAAVGASMAAQVGMAVCGALAATAVGWMGSVVVEKLTVDGPMWLKFRKLRKLYDIWAIAEGPALDGVERVMRSVEESVVDVVSAEAAQDRTGSLDWIVARVAEARERGEMGPYRGLVGLLAARLRMLALDEGGWAAARKYYQLLASAGDLPRAR